MQDMEQLSRMLNRLHHDMDFYVREDDEFKCCASILRDWGDERDPVLNQLRSIGEESDVTGHAFFCDQMYPSYDFFDKALELVKKGAEDTYISLNGFAVPQRRTEYLRHLNGFLIDYDYYKIKQYKNLSAEDMYRNYIEPTLPFKPSYVIDSGRGLYVLYLFEHASKVKLKMYKHIYKQLCDSQKKFGADPKATLVTQVFRMPGTLNSKTLREVQIIEENNTNYTIFQFRDKVLPYSAEEVLEFKNKTDLKQQNKASHNISKKELASRKKKALVRIEDLKTLIQLRGGAVEGHREYLLYLTHELCMWADMSFDERSALVEEVNLLFDKPMGDYEVHRQSVPPKEYEFCSSVKKIIKNLEITEEEQEKMKSLHSVKVQRRKHQRFLRRNPLMNRTSKQMEILVRRKQVCIWFSEGREVQEVLELYIDTYDCSIKTFKRDLAYIKAHPAEFKGVLKTLKSDFVVDFSIFKRPSTSIVEKAVYRPVFDPPERLCLLI